MVTVQEVHDFVAAINAGREAIGLTPVESIGYDGCVPNQGDACLSARHLFLDAAEGDVQTVVSVRTALVSLDYKADLLSALDTREPNKYECDFECPGEIMIPEAILRVTNVFDRSDGNDNLREELRNVFVEAGYVEPR